MFANIPLASALLIVADRFAAFAGISEAALAGGRLTGAGVALTAAGARLSDGDVAANAAEDTVISIAAPVKSTCFMLNLQQFRWRLE